MESPQNFTTQLRTLLEPQHTNHTLLTFYSLHANTLLTMVKAQKYRDQGEADTALLGDIMSLLARVITVEGSPMPEILVMVNNILNLMNSAVHLLTQRQGVTSRICDQFKSFCSNYQDKLQQSILTREEESECNFTLYCNFHLLSVLLGEACKQDSDPALSSQLCHPSMVRTFLSIGFEEIKKSEIHRLCSIICVFLVKKLDLKRWAPTLTSYVLRSLPLVSGKNKQNMVNCLKKILQSAALSPRDIRRHRVVEFVVKSLDEETPDQSVSDLVQLALLILQKTPEFSQEFYQAGLVQQIIKVYVKVPGIAASLLQKLVPCMTPVEKDQLFLHFENMLHSEQFQKSVVKCLTFLIPGRPMFSILKSLESKMLEKARAGLTRVATYNNISLLFYLYEITLTSVRAGSGDLFLALLDRVMVDGGLQEIQTQYPQFGGIVCRFRAAYKFEAF